MMLYSRSLPANKATTIRGFRIDHRSHGQWSHVNPLTCPHTAPFLGGTSHPTHSTSQQPNIHFFGSLLFPARGSSSAKSMVNWNPCCRCDEAELLMVATRAVARLLPGAGIAPLLCSNTSASRDASSRLLMTTSKHSFEITLRSCKEILRRRSCRASKWTELTSRASSRP